MTTRLLMILFLFSSLSFMAKGADEEPSQSINNIKFKALRLLRNDPVDNRAVQIARSKFKKAILIKRFKKSMREMDVKQQGNTNRILTKVYPITLKERGNDRDPAYFFIPKKYRKNRSWPLVISLHGYSSFQFVQNIFLPLDKWVSKKGYILAIPSGNLDENKKQFWNATEFCCNFSLKKIDDESYLKKLIYYAKTKYNISKVIIMGHSNGGFMAQNMACNSGNLIDGIVTWGGSTFYDPRDCKSKNPVNILHLHGTNDGTIPFNGSTGVLPSAPSVVKQWGKQMKCQKKKNFIKGFSLKTKYAGIFSRQIDFSGFKNCLGGKKSILGVVPKGTHTRPLAYNLWEFIVDASVFNNFDIEKTKVNYRKLKKFK